MPPYLEIARAEIVLAFKLLRKLCKPKRDEEAVLSFDGQCFHIELGGMTVTPGASGTWPGQARVPARFIMGLAKVPPSGEPISVRIADGRLHIGSSSITCHWQAPWSKQIELPMNPTAVDYLMLRLQHTEEEIAQSGLAETVRHVEEQANRKIAAAAMQLKEFEVTPSDLQTFIYDRLRKKAADTSH